MNQLERPVDQELSFANVAPNKVVELRIRLTVGPGQDRFYRQIAGYDVLPSAAQCREFIVDTGATRTVITYKLARKLGLIERSSHKVNVCYFDGHEGRFYESEVRLFVKSWHTVPCWIPVPDSARQIHENILGMEGILGEFLLILSHEELAVLRLPPSPHD